MKSLSIALVGLLIVLGSAVAASPARATVSGENGLIAFASDRDGDLEIYVIKPDGTGLTRLTHSPGDDTSPAWSPDGQQIVFVRNTGTGKRLVVMNADGSDQRVIEDALLGAGNPAWSPDGSTIAFDSIGHGGQADIYLMSVDDSSQRRLMSTSTTDWGPEWSPDGLRIAFARGTAAGRVYIVNSDGSSEVLVTPDYPRGVQPSWAPDGRTIAASHRHVWLHDVEGALSPIPLAGDPGSDFGENPAWSPDGSLVAVQDPEEGLELWRSDGSGSTPLTSHTGDRQPAWQPINPYPKGLVDPATGQWHLRDATGRVESFYYGDPGDYPIMGDWDCDGVDTPGLYRQSDGYVYLRNTNTQGGADLTFFFGNPGDLPLAGDFNGDGCDTVSIYRTSQSKVFIINKLGSADTGLGAAEIDYYFGNPGDTPFSGDFDGDGIDTIGLYRQTTGLVYFRNTHTQGNADNEFLFGNPGDRFVAGDWNHDGTDTPSVYRPDNATHYFRFTNAEGNAEAQYIWGHPDWIPVAGTYTHK